MNLGILGGTFNPIHLAHLRLAEEMLESLGLERALFIPAAIPPLKHSGVAAAEHRLEMVRRATADNPRFEVLALELQRAGKSYTVDTLCELTQLYPGTRLWFLIGTDAFAELNQWYRAEELFELANFAVATRLGSSGPDQLDCDGLLRLLPANLVQRFRRQGDALQHDSGNEMRVIQFTPLRISATDIRNRVRTQRSVRYLVPEVVAEYIQKHRLYEEKL